MIKNTFRIFLDINTVAMAVAENLLRISLEAKAENRTAQISLSGGSTPKKLFQILSTADYLNEIAWSNLRFWWGDERMVSYDSEESNYGEAKRLLFDLIPPENLKVNPVRTELKNEDAVIDYANQLEEHLDLIGGIPVFDWMILGMGDDGHTASLFPNGVSLDLESTTALATHPTSGQKRVSLTLKTLNQSKRISFLVTGKNKASILRDIIEEKGDYKSWPTHAVKNQNNQREWFLDLAAAEFINEGKS